MDCVSTTENDDLLVTDMIKAVSYVYPSTEVSLDVLFGFVVLLN